MKFKILIIMLCTLIVATSGMARVVSDTDDDNGDSQNYISDGQGGWTADNNYNNVPDIDEEIPLPGSEECVDWLHDNHPDLLEFDSDDDTWPNQCDNCIYISNDDQKDTNFDGIGDACKGKRDLKPEELSPPEVKYELCPSGTFDVEDYPDCECEEDTILGIDEETGMAECKVPETPDPSTTYPQLTGDKGCNIQTAFDPNSIIILLSSIVGILIRKKI